MEVMLSVLALLVLFVLWRRRVRRLRRQDLLSTTFADTTSGIPRQPRWLQTRREVDL